MEAFPRSLFVSHGGGPLPLLGDAAHQRMVSCLKGISADMSRPEAIVVVSAHWEAEVPTVTASAAPSLIYDYYGFPSASYEVLYPCPGHTALASAVQGMLLESGINAELDERRGLDHGVFVPLKIMYPEADIPCVQLSLSTSLDAGFHIEMGAALSGLADQGVLLMGSGFSFHNIRAFFAEADDEGERLNAAFERWLAETCGNADISEETRAERLRRWTEAPGARFCHPREEHLLPLHVCYGAAARPYAHRHELSILHKQASMVRW